MAKQQEHAEVDVTVRAEDRLMTIAEVAELLGVPPRTLYQWRSNREGPIGYRVGRYVRYRRAAVEEWLEQQVDRRERRPQLG